MKVVVASASLLKIRACVEAFSHVSGVKVIGIATESLVNVQPREHETASGAFNRLDQARRIDKDADYYVSIESGLFVEQYLLIDRAFIVISSKSAETVELYSAGVEFPADCVLEVAKRGFDVCTVGEVMQDRGIVEWRNDPHRSLTGKSRAAYITEALKKAVTVIL